MFETIRSHARVTRFRAAAAVSTALALGLLASPAAGDKPAGEKRRAREIGIMERTIDDVLVESHHVLVGGRSVTQGLYLDGIGAVFTFSMDVIPLHWGFDEFAWWDGSHHIEVEDDGERVIIYKSGDDDDDDEVVVEKNKGKGKTETKTKSKEQRREEAKKAAEEHFADGKAELVDVVLDYGAATLGSLADTEWVVLAARFSGARASRDAGVKRLVIKAKMSDLRALDAGTITREVARTRVRIEES